MEPPLRTLAGRVAFVTGAASGIGFGIAAALGAAGARVMLCDRDAAGLEQAAASLRKDGVDADGIVADVSIKTELQAAAQKTLERFGRVHVLVNNAGVGGGGRYGSWSDSTWRWLIDVNLMAVVWGIEIFVPLIESHGEGGHIVSTASMAGLIPAGSSPYTVTKYGVVGLSEGLRRELESRHIGVSVLCPGLVRTRVAEVERNRPDRFKEARGSDAPPMTSAQAEKLTRLVATGCEPRYVGELVREGIEANLPYIFTDTAYEAAVDARFAAIKEAFARVRGRNG